jgi:hypothetical protein
MKNRIDLSLDWIVTTRTELVLTSEGYEGVRFSISR